MRWRKNFLMDERQLVTYLKKNFPFSSGVGIGDDCAVFQTSEKEKFLLTTDLLVEDIDFKREWYKPQQLALRALAVNLSDIAAMGGCPLHFYLSLAWPNNFTAGLKKFFQGIKQGCRKWQIEMAGGDYSQADKIFINITLVGKADNPVLRQTARYGDLIAVSGYPGEAALGLNLLKNGINSGYFVRRHISVEPEIKTGKTISSYVNAMIDVSDGLLLDLERLLEASAAGGTLVIDSLPVKKNFIKICRQWQWNPLDFILSGGEDFLLLFTFSPEKELELRRTGINFFIIGRVEKKRGLRLQYRKADFEFRKKGFDHFKD